MFWLLAVFLGLTKDTQLPDLLIWVVAVFISILWHELGHALVIRAFGHQPWITLYAMGGLTSHDPRRNPRSAGNSAWGQVLISFAGPGAGFLLVAIILGILIATGHRDNFIFGRISQYIPVPIILNIGNERMAMFLNDIFLISVFWGVLNLLPIYPLDGGQIAREAFLFFNPRQGIPQSLMLSIATALLVAFYMVFHYKSIFNGMVFGYFAYESYQILQAYSGRGRW
jgi:membrane-associated protease RseP (regulator of RpoE activity)